MLKNYTTIGQLLSQDKINQLNSNGQTDHTIVNILIIVLVASFIIMMLSGSSLIKHPKITKPTFIISITIFIAAIIGNIGIMIIDNDLDKTTIDNYHDEKIPNNGLTYVNKEKSIGYPLLDLNGDNFIISDQDFDQNMMYPIQKIDNFQIIPKKQKEQIVQTNSYQIPKITNQTHHKNYFYGHHHSKLLSDINYNPADKKIKAKHQEITAQIHRDHYQKMHKEE